MEYNRLPKLINTYPQTSNYITTGIDKSSLLGLYSDINKVDFNLASLENITIVPDTKLRNIIAIYEDRNDETPQYYTSEIYHRDLAASKVEANPYFLNASFESFHIIDIYLKELVDSLDAYKDAELKLELNFIRNNFILFNNAGITAAPKKIFNIAAAVAEGDRNLSRNNQIDSLGESITKLENEISNVGNKIKRKGLFGSRAEIDFEGEKIRSNIPFNRGKQVTEIKNKLSDKLLRLKERKKELEDEKIQTAVSKIVTQDVKKENVKIDKVTFLERIKNRKIKVAKEKDLIEINGVFVDCVLLVKYIDWVLSEPSLSEIEEGGVINPTLLLDFEKAVPEVITTDKLDSNNNTNETNPTPAGNQGTGNFFEYQIIRLSIPATLDSSRMTFKTPNGQIQSVQTADYGFVGTYCIEENSFNGNHNLYQKTQLAPCNTPSNTTGGGGGYRGGGSYDYYDNQNKNIEYIDRQKDFQNIQ